MAYINGKKIGQIVKTTPVAVDIEANPSGEATEVLEKLKVDDTIYSIDGGASSPDSAMSDSSVNAVQNKVIKQYVDNEIDKIEDGRTVVGKAQTAQALDNVSENSGSTQEDPFIAQGTGTNNNTSETPTSPKAHQLEKQGNTVCVNQWNDTITDTVNMTSGSSYKELKRTPLPNVQNDKVLVIGKIDFSESANANTSIVHFNISATGHNAYIDTNVSVVNGMFAKVFTLDYANSSISFFAFASTTFGSGESVKYSDYYVINLNQWGFASNTITYLTSHPEAFINYYNGSLAYNEGTLTSSDGVSLVTVGFNQFDKDTIKTSAGNYILDDNGQQVADSSSSYFLEYIRVIPNTTYYFNNGVNENGIQRIYYYDNNKNWIARTPAIASGTTFTTKTNCCYIRIQYKQNNFNADSLCINLHWDGERDGEYQAYVKHTYNTGITSLRSIGALKDIKYSDGTHIQKIKQKVYSSTDVTLGYEYSNIVYYAIPKPSDYIGNNSYLNAVGTIACNKYNVISALDDWDSANGIRTINGQANDSNFWIGFAVGTTLAQAQAAINGLHLNYVLATPTTEQGTRFDEIIDVDDYGTMYWLDDNEDFVEVPQGCKLFYPADYALLIDDLGNYTNYNVNNLAKKSDLTDFVKIHCHSLRFTFTNESYAIRIFANVFTPTKTSLLTFANLIADMTNNNYSEIICSGAVLDKTNNKNMVAVYLNNQGTNPEHLRLVCQNEDGDSKVIALNSFSSYFSNETII